MLVEEKAKIIVSFEYPQTSIVISNNDRDLALMFEISFNRLIKDKQKQTEEDEILNQQKSTTFSPSKGILLPLNSQLISIRIKTLEEKNSILPLISSAAVGRLREGQKSRRKRIRTQQPVTSLIGSITISYSYLLHYNQQKLQQQTVNAAEFDLTRLNNIQTENIPLYLQYSPTPNTNTIHRKHSISLNRSPFNNNHRLIPSLMRNQNKYQTLISYLSKQPQSAVNIDVPSSKSFLKQNSFPIQELPKAQSSKQNEVDKIINKVNDRVIGDKLNQDLKIIKSKTTLDEIQAKRSDMFVKMLQSQPISDKLYKNNDLIDEKKKVQGGFHKTPVFLDQNSGMEQSIVIKSFHHIGDQIEKGQASRQKKVNSLSIELIVLAVIAAVFVSLGANLRALFK